VKEMKLDPIAQDPACCPTLDKGPCCDVLDFRYRLPHRVVVNEGNRQGTVTVEVTLHLRLTRCPGPLSLGDPVHTITLLPGEKVRLFTSDRRSRFTLDSSTNVSYRSEQLSEENYFMAAMQNSMSDLSVTDSAQSSNSESGKWDFHGDASGSLGFFSASADTNARGSHSSQSTSDFLRELRTHATASANQSVQATRAASSVSIGEVSSRSHVQTESEDHFESSSREFRNENRCHAVTYLFYRLNKKQIVKITLEAIERRVDDPGAPTKVTLNPPVSRGQISVTPASVLATQKDRVAVEQVGRQSVAAQKAADLNNAVGLAEFSFAREPLSDGLRKAALKQVDTNLANEGLLTPAGEPSPEARKRFEVTVESCLPTPGIIVRGCIDTCDICEPELHQKIMLELEEQALKNKLLEKQIELLEKSQEYRCCPAGSEPAP
jgi:hypothetical protein